MIDNEFSRGKGLVLRSNGIKNRYYALDDNSNITHTNAQITKEAINLLFDEDFSLDDLELLACGTTSPDQLLPSHTSMVHGELKGKPIEILSPSGSCCSGMNAMKFGYLSVLSGSSKNAICTGSEAFSSWMLAGNYEGEADKLRELKQRPIVAFEKDFLRWMLSDGAGAALLEPEPRGETSLKIEWLEMLSFANELDTCMYAGTEKTESGSTEGWRHFTGREWLGESIFALKQDVKLLDKNITLVGTQMLKDICDRRNFDVNEIDYFLPHISSEFFRKKIEDETERLGIYIKPEKWFTNLDQVGNVGAGSIYLMIEELFNSGKLKKGQKMLLMVPESARFTYAYCLLTVC